jgi:hypothetical protein
MKMLKQKRGMELTTSTIIIIVLALFVLVIIILFATGAFGNIGSQIIGKIKWAFGIWPKNMTG